MPGFDLCVAGIEMGKEFRVCEVKQVGSIIGHGISGAQYIVLEGQVAMMVNGLHAEKESRRNEGCDKAFTMPEHGGNVASVCFDGLLMDVKALDGGLVLEKAASQLEV
jgi:hypothetical protein